MVSRGIRNNNPGNIRKSTEKWQGLSKTQTDESFFQFESMEYGIRAIASILKTYYKKYGLDTVRSIINRWAPPNENATDNYIAAVCKAVGVGDNDKLRVSDPYVLFLLIKGIVKQENGPDASVITDDQIRKGISLS